MCFRRLASVLCEGWRPSGGQSVGGTVLLLQSEVPWLIDLVEQPAGGDLPVAWLQSPQKSSSGGQADRPMPHTNVSNTFTILYHVNPYNIMKDACCQIMLYFMWLMWCLGAHLSWVWEMAALWMSRKWRRGKSQQISGTLLNYRTGSHMTACYKVWCITNYAKSHANVLLFIMQWTFATIFSQEMNFIPSRSW